MRYTVIFQPSGKKAYTDGQHSVLHISQEAGVPIESLCGGKGICGKCRVVVEKGNEKLPPPTEREIKTLGELINRGYRLACETIPACDVTLRVPDESRIDRQVILTTAKCVSARLDPVIKNIYIEVPQPTLDNPMADSERLLTALRGVHRFHNILIDSMAIRKLPHVIRECNGRLTVTVWNNREILDIASGINDNLYGIAFDIGTTTVVAYLMDLLKGKELSVKAAMNPQVAYGDNVVSRISYCAENPDGLEKLRSVLLRCMNTLIEEACEEANIKTEQVLESVIVGNTVMHHLFLGLDPQYIALAPYCPVIQSPMQIKARDAYLEISPSGYVRILPVKAGFVGGDTVGVIIATEPHRRDHITLVIDLGTNGEIVLGDRNRLLCCSTAAGPAFEGGHIKWGMRATSGAVERVMIDPETLDVELKTIDNYPPLGICGSGLISAVSGLIRADVIMEKGNFNPKISSPRLRKGHDGPEFVLAWAEETGIRSDLVITQRDVAELQLAKAAIHAGITILMRRMGLTGINRILLAGAFGTYINPEDACVIGLIPDCLSANIESVGNAAGAGSCLALLNKTKWKETERIAQKMDYVELSADPEFNELFVEGMFFKSRHTPVSI